MALVFCAGLLIIPAPLIIVQLPEPTDGALPFNVKVVAQMVALLPALEAVGKSSRLINTVELDAGQTPLVMVQSRTLLPTPKLVSTALWMPVLFNVAGPLSTDQLPEPTVGPFPFKVKEMAQIVVLFPAFDGVGKSSREMFTVETDGGHTPLLIVH
jgi:hypothetical protein